MPLYELRCTRCDQRFEALVSAGTMPRCPECGSARTERLFSPISRPLKFGLRGIAARRSDAARRAREERRREQRARRRQSQA